MDMLKKICIKVAFLKALKEAPSYLRLLMELLFKKGKPNEASVIPLGEMCGEVLQSLSKLQDPWSFSILYFISGPIDRKSFL